MGDGSCDRMELRVWNSSSHCLIRRGVRPGDEQIVAGGHDALGDGGDLVRGLSWAENDFRDPLTGAAVVVDPGESEVFEGSLA
jgi:hypothetical protein